MKIQMTIDINQSENAVGVLWHMEEAIKEYKLALARERIAGEKILLNHEIDSQLHMLKVTVLE